MSPQDTIDYIKQLTDELGTAYGLQEDFVVAEIDRAKDLVGNFKEYHCRMCTPLYGWKTENPSAWDWIAHVGNLKTDDHSRQGEARGHLIDAGIEYNTTADEQKSRQEKLTSIPSDLGAFLIDWFTVHSDFSTIDYPAHKHEVPAPGDSWASGNVGAYDGAISTQHRTATATRGIVGSLVSNTTSFLGEVTSTLANLTDHANAQVEFYENALMVPFQDYSSLSGAINLFKGVITSMQEGRRLFFDRVAEQGRMLASALDTVVNVSMLENDLRSALPGGQWQGPTNVESNLDNPGGPSVDMVRTDAQWFQAHINVWDGIADDLAPLETKASGFSRIPGKVVEMPHIADMQTDKLNDLGKALASAIGGGRTAAEDLADALRETIRNYIFNEIGSRDEAEALFNEYFPN